MANTRLQQLPNSLPFTIASLSVTSEASTGAAPMTSKAAGQASGALWLPDDKLTEKGSETVGGANCRIRFAWQLRHRPNG